MDVGRRLKLGLLAVVALIGATMVFSTVAQARSIPDPMLTNVPYLAWRGEELRLVKCDPTLTPGDLLSPGDVDFLLVDWSGDPHLASPQLVPGTVAVGFRSFDGAGCVQGTFESSKAGIAMIKMVVTNPAGEKVLVHDFLAAWMNLNSIVACTKPDPGPCGLGAPTSATDVAGGIDNANVIEANVTGNIPLLQDFNELGIGHPITLPDGTTANGLVMPDDWATWAHAMATARGPLVGPNPAQFWDIHDDTLPTEGHHGENPCAVTEPGIDAVDECTDAAGVPDNTPGSGTDERGPFSSIWQQLIGAPTAGRPAYGPFDPARPGETELSDGKLDAGDAPMPAARIDFTIASNTGGPTDISGVGSFTKVDKGFCEDDAQTAAFGCIGGTYVRPVTQPHRLYAPFYRRYIPATRAPGDPFSSGTDDGFANNFNGYLNLTGNALANDNGLYDFWDIAEVLREAPGALTNCLNFTNGNGVPIFRLGPEGPQSVAVYSDEHGEARVGFIPGTGFFFDNFGIVNANLGCDLAGIATLGTAQITATARYPFQPVTAQPITSNTVSKAVTSAFAKSIQCFPKGPSAFDQQVAVCVASAQDITGAAIAGERVCFFADNNAEGIFLPAIPGGFIAIGPYIGGTGHQAPIEILPAPNLNGTHSVCAFTDVNGRTAVEVVNSNPTTVNVSAFFVDEGLFRSVHVQFPITAPTVKVTGPVAARNPAVIVTPTAGGGPPSGTVSNPTVNPGEKPPVAKDPSVQVRYTIKSARLVRPLRGRPYLRIRLVGPAGKATFMIRYMSTKKQIGQVVKTVRANRTVKVRLFIPRKVRTMHLSVMPG